jgi:hypothetical protein
LRLKAGPDGKGVPTQLVAGFLQTVGDGYVLADCPAKTDFNARRTRRVLVPARQAPAIKASAAFVRY